MFWGRRLRGDLELDLVFRSLFYTVLLWHAEANSLTFDALIISDFLLMSFPYPFYMQGLLPPAPYPSFPEYPVPAYLNRSYSLNPLQVGSVPLEASFYVDRVSPMLIHQQNNYFAANYRAPLVINNPFYQKMQISNDNKVNQLANSSEQGQLYSATHLSNNRRSTKPIEIIEISDE